MNFLPGFRKDAQGNTGFDISVLLAESTHFGIGCGIGYVVGFFVK